MNNHLFVRRSMLLLTLMLLIISIGPALAQATPSVVVAPAWRPGIQLTTLDTNGAAYPTWDSGDDYRYLDVEIYATLNVQFWTAQMTCTVPGGTTAVLEGNYIVDTLSATGDPGDDVAQVRWNEDIWGSVGSTYTAVNEPFNSTTGARTFTASRLGSAQPLGLNGISQTILLARLRYRVKPQALNFTSSSPTFNCTSTFLNRNGANVVPSVMYSAPVAPTIIPGYTIKGKALYQARIAHTGIGVSCTFDADGPPNPPVTLATAKATDAIGSFTFTNLRQLGWYYCRSFGNLVTAEVINTPPTQQVDVYLAAETWVNLFEQSYTLLPLTLKLGNVERVASPTSISNLEDVAAVTGNWNAPYPPTTNFGLGDANNDKKVDKIDLAVVAANMDLQENVNGQHLLVSGQRTTSAVFNDSRIWMANDPIGTANTTVSQLITGANRDFWPRLSPDGSKLAFVRAVGTGAALRYAIFVSSSDGSGVATQITPANWGYDAFAPSWSLDGTRIAFNCSVVPVSGERPWRFDRVQVCAMDSNGRNITFLASEAKIYPPAWYKDPNVGDSLVFGGTANNPICTSMICQVSIGGGAPHIFDTDIGAGTDMPTIAFGKIYYRADPSPVSGQRVLRVATLNAVPGPVTGYQPNINAANPITYNIDVQFDTSGTQTSYSRVADYVDYYIIPSNLSENIIIGTFASDFATYYNGGDAFRLLNAIKLPSRPLEWSDPGVTQFRIDSLFVNPGWTGVDTDPTNLFGLRNAMDWAS